VRSLHFVCLSFSSTPEDFLLEIAFLVDSLVQPLEWSPFSAGQEILAHRATLLGGGGDLTGV
jgi:hypothetical protein